ncbi:MAG: alpha/beta fold hydrolase [Flavobacteriaceae bacterium]|nr:alpha/beta fold hydrolase [Flavobacteriaceae bacterium]MDG2314280.1 alpha/beta fold hydrolase [Flavobacteriaceae bacterium]
MILHATQFGSGQPLLILHGFLGMSDNWKTFAKNISNSGFEVHLIDQRNHGKSFHSSEFSYDLMADDLERYAVHMGLSKFHLLGHSMGGKTAMFYAGKYSNRVEKLVIADIAPKYYPPHHQKILKGLTALDFDTISSRKQADTELQSYISEVGVRQFLLKNLYWKTKNSLGLRANISVLSQKAEAVGEAMPSSYFFEGSALFLKGENSDYITDADSIHLKQHFPNATIQTIQNAGHWLHAENPVQFYEKTYHFLIKKEK